MTFTPRVLYTHTRVNLITLMAFKLLMRFKPPLLKPHTSFNKPAKASLKTGRYPSAFALGESAGQPPEHRRSLFVFKEPAQKEPVFYRRRSPPGDPFADQLSAHSEPPGKLGLASVFLRAPRL
jgi:hypothetical protein